MDEVIENIVTVFRAHELDSEGVIIQTIMVTDINFIPNLIDATVGGNVGDSVINGELVVKSVEVVKFVPSSVTMRQARLALLAANKLSSVTAAINSLPSPQKEAAQIEWEFSSVVERNRPLVQMLGPALELSEDELDALFINAATL